MAVEVLGVCSQQMWWFCVSLPPGKSRAVLQLQTSLLAKVLELVPDKDLHFQNSSRA